MVSWLAPAAVLIDEKLNILYIAGDVDKFMQHPQGVPKEDLLEKARRGLRVKLRSAVHRAFAQDESVSVTAQVEWNGSAHPVQILVRPCLDGKEDRKLALVVFDDRPAPLPAHLDSEIDSQRVAEIGQDDRAGNATSPSSAAPISMNMRPFANLRMSSTLPAKANRQHSNSTKPRTKSSKRPMKR